jgi:DNA-binding transcriptional MocR family regulator
MTVEFIQGGGADGMMPFVYGHVDPALFPIEHLQQASRDALAVHGASALNYGAGLGFGELRTYLREKLNRDEGLGVETDELMLTSGASAGLDTVVRLFTAPGDTVLVEAPSYHEAVANIRDHPVKLAAVPLDKEGLVVDALAERLESLTLAGERPALLYTIPSFQNPSGVTLGAERRPRVLELAYRYRLLVVEDDVYRDLCFHDTPPRSLYALDNKGVVIRLGSFSKILAPGLRLGWVMGPAVHIERMVNCGLTLSGGGANPFVACMVAVYCRRGWLEPHIDALRKSYRQRRDVLLAALEAHMPPGVTWTEPGGGFFVWLTLPAPLTASAVLAQAGRHGVTFLTGEPFYAEGGGERHVRLPFSYLQPQDLARGVEILADITSRG